MKIQSFIIIVSACFAFSSCQNGQNSTDSVSTDTTSKNLDTVILKTNASVPMDSADVSFLEHAAYGGMTEVEGSNKILQYTNDPKIKAFAEMMTRDHGQANQLLKELATNKGYELPRVLPDSKLKRIDEMTSFKAEGRDEYYLRLMLLEHKNAVNLFSAASRSQNSDIASFAQKLLPTLNTHLQEVKRLDSLHQLAKVNQGDDPLKLSNRKKN